MMKINVINKSTNPLPKYESDGAAGLDLCADVTESVTIQPMTRCLIPTGLHLKLGKGYEAQVRPRSGLALKHGITVLNTPGTIDSDYRGNIGVILINLGEKEFTINKGDKIAQLVFAKHEQVEWNEVKELDNTERGQNGFGSTTK